VLKISCARDKGKPPLRRSSRQNGDGYEYKYNTKITDGPAFYAGTCQKGCKVQASGERAEKKM